MPDEITVHEAKTHLSKLLRRVEDGEEFIVRRGKTPIARITKYEEPKPRRQLGAMKGQIWMAEDFDATPEEFREYIE